MKLIKKTTNYKRTDYEGKKLDTGFRIKNIKRFCKVVESKGIFKKASLACNKEDLILVTNKSEVFYIPVLERKLIYTPIVQNRQKRYYPSRTDVIFYDEIEKENHMDGIEGWLSIDNYLFFKERFITEYEDTKNIYNQEVSGFKRFPEFIRVHVGVKTNDPYNYRIYDKSTGKLLFKTNYRPVKKINESQFEVITRKVNCCNYIEIYYGLLDLPSNEIIKYWKEETE